MPCNGEVQRITESYLFAQFLQVVIDAVQKAVILFPLLVRGFCRNDGGRGGPCLSVCIGRISPLTPVPRNGDFLACDVLAIGELSVLDIVSCQPENVIASYSLGVDRKQEDVTSEDGHL